MTLAMISNFLFRRSADQPNQEDHFLRLPKEIVREILKYVNNPCLTASLSRNFARLSRDETALHDFFRFFSEHIEKRVEGRVVARLLSATQTRREVYGGLYKELKELGLDPVKVGLCFNDPSTYHLADSLIQAKNFCLFCSRIPGINVDESKLQEPKDIFGERDLCYQQFNTLNIANIQELRLGNLALTRLPPDVGCLVALKRLELSDNYLTRLPAEIGNLTDLNCLYLDANQLRTLPAEIGKLENLRELHLTANQLRALPAEIGKLENLRELYLNENQLTELPSEIGNLQNLCCLHFCRNQLTEFPTEICNLKSLKELLLHANQLIKLPLEIRNLRNLKFLDLGKNRLAAFPEELKPFLNALDVFKVENTLRPNRERLITS